VIAQARSLLALLLAALALLTPGTAQADERILSWLSDIEVRADGSLDVTETIRVTVEGNQISRGIYRDFPTTYVRDGRPVRVGFEVHSVERDGQPEPYATEGAGNGVRVRIGDADVFLPYGEHTYVIRYTTTRQLGFFDGYDELYWNVTGNGWMFPIDKAEARIRLPQPVPFGPERAFYTGPQGSTARDAAVVSEQPGEIVIRSTTTLYPYEGLTVAVRWQKGVVAEPPKPTAAQLEFQDEGPRAGFVAALLAMLAYYFVAWKKAGRGPSAGTVVPQFTPPEGMSAAGLRYVNEMGFDDRCFAAAIVESGVHGEIKLVEGEKPFFGSAKTTLIKTSGKGGLQRGERAMLTALFSGSNSIEMDDANHARFGAARKALEAADAGGAVPSLAPGQALVAADARRGVRARRHRPADLLVPAAGPGGAVLELGVDAGAAGHPAAGHFGLLLDGGSDQPRPCDDGPHRRVRAVPLDHRGRAFRDAASAREDARAVRAVPALRDRARGGEQLGGQVRRRARRRGGRSHEGGSRRVRLVFGVEQRVVQSQPLCRDGRCLARQRGRLGVDGARFEQRLGRRRIVGRWRRRRWRRRLVAAATGRDRP
jgi:hypothetical protein